MCSKSDTIVEKSQYTQTYLLVRFNPHAQRTEESRNIFHGEESDTLRWSVSSFFVSSSFAIQKFIGANSSTSSTQQSLFDCRKYSCFTVSEHARHRSHRDNSFAEAQWSVSLSCGHSSLSQSNNLAKVLSATLRTRHCTSALASRAVVEEDVRETASTKENDS